MEAKPSEFKIDTDESDISLPAVTVFFGCRGSGEAYSCIMLIRHFEMKIYINRTFLISPTHQSNDIYRNLKTLKPEDCFTDDKTFQQELQHIMIVLADDCTKYRTNKEYTNIYQKWVSTPCKLNLRAEIILV